MSRGGFLSDFIAHIKTDKNNVKNLEDTHQLKEHIQGVLEIAKSFSDDSTWHMHIELTVLLHDIGKYQAAFQNYIRDDNGVRGSVHHAKYGAIIACFKYRAKEVSFIVDGHHSGLKDFSNWAAKYKKIDPNDKEILKEIGKCLDAEIQDSKLFLQKFICTIQESGYSELQRDVITRLLFSFLVDADWLDTERFMDIKKYNLRKAKPMDIDFLSGKLREKLKSFSSDGEINELRNTTREMVVNKSNHGVGFFSLALPTGIGKTLTSLNWAIEHAKHNNLKRIIIVLPYTSIIDQTASILKALFGEEYVLEHHSNITINENNSSETKKQDSHKLNCENWDSPIIVTTTVQFFESLFSNRTSKCRKLHNIMNSVVIFDEVQVLDKGIIKPTLKMLENMQPLFNSSFLFCTATMPAFEKRDNFDGIAHIVPLIDNPSFIFEKTKRVDYHLHNNLEAVSLDNLIESIMQENYSTLVVVNTKSIALEIYKEIEQLDKFDKVIHLSTNMYPKHRKAVIKQVTRDLASEKKILLISTQLIEAGVDLDFHTVYREISPLSSIIQSAGRCNRNAILEKGTVYIFALENSRTPGSLYETEAKETSQLLQENGVDSLHKHDIFNDYYKKICDLYQQEEDKISKARVDFNFQTVAESYKLIKNDTEPLFIPKAISPDDEQEIRQLRKKIEEGIPLNRDDYRKISQYSVNAYRSFIFKYNAKGLLSEQNNLFVWSGEYSPEYGLETEDFFENGSVL